MSENHNSKTALALMRMALPLLDKAGEGLAACHLQSAIDVATRQAPMRPGEELDPALIERHLGQG